MNAFTTRIFILLIASAPFVGSAQNASQKILFIAGPPSHGWNEHEFPAGCELLAQCLNQSNLGIDAQVSLGWPEDTALLENANTIVLYSDGNEEHVAKGKTDTLENLFNQGVNFAILHYALEPGTPELNAFLSKAIGAYFEVDWSVNPVWTLEDSTLAQHSITNGVSFETVKDEWYYHLRFPTTSKGVTTLLSTIPPESSLGEDGPRTGNPAVRAALKNRIPQTLAWLKAELNQPRGFGFTGGHYHNNWNDEAQRKLVLNGIAWTAGIEIPANGIESKIAPIVKHQSIEHAIALGDLEDLHRYIANDPEIINRPGRGSYTPLHQAILRKKRALITSLLKQGADPNAPTKSKQTSLHIAISRNDLESTKAVLDAGADLSLRDGSGWTPLHLAAAKNKLELAEYLLERGANPKLLSDAGGTPLHEASVSGSEAILQLLLDHGVDPDVVSKTGKTALDHAIEFKNEAAIKLLKAQR
ncbi:MAG: ankyrin repeat protein [Candidatus Pelagisphaera sp.]|jgi:ankyrin repeat protein